MSTEHVLTQWIEGCQDYELCDNIEIVSEDDHDDDHQDYEAYIGTKYEGTYYQFMAAPTVMGLASVVGLVEGAYAETIWAAAMGWGGFMTYFIGIWFHEFFRGGPNEVDSLFSNYIGTSYVAFGVLGLITAFAGYKTGSTVYPITFTANFGATVFGFWLT